MPDRCINVNFMFTKFLVLVAGHGQIPKRWEGNKNRSDGNGKSLLQEKDIQDI